MDPTLSANPTTTPDTNSSLAEEPRKRKRQRAIISCTECHRRKQKCDRKEPCGNCLLRSAIHLCRYEATNTQGSSEIPVDRKSVPESSSNSSTDSQGSSPNSQTTEDETDFEGVGSSYGYSQAVAATGTPADLLGKLNLCTAEKDTICFEIPPTITAAEYHRFVSLIPPRPYVLLLVRVFFSECNWLYATVNEGIFHLFLEEWYLTLHKGNQSNFSRERRRELSQFPVLLLQVMAIALQTLPPEHFSEISHLTLGSTDFRALSAAYSNGSIELATILSSAPATLPRIQAWAWRSSWLKSASRPVESWHAVGHAIREAQELGLHKERPQQIRGVGNESFFLWRREEERRVWTILYAFDRFMSVVLSRPTMINDLHCSVAEPINCDFPRNIGVEIPMSKGPDDKIPGESLWRVFDARLSRHTPDIEALHCKLALRGGTPDNVALIELQKKFEDYTEKFPPALRFGSEDMKNLDIDPSRRPRYLTAQAALVHCTQHSMICCVHRPFIFSSTQSRTSIFNSSLRILIAQEALYQEMRPWQRRVYGLNWFTFEAAVLCAAVVITEPTKGLRLWGNEKLKEAKEEMGKAVKRMENIGTMVELAQNGAKVLEILRKRVEEKMEKYEEEMAAAVAEAQTPAKIESGMTPQGWEDLGYGHDTNVGSFGEDLVAQLGTQGVLYGGDVGLFDNGPAEHDGNTEASDGVMVDGFEVPEEAWRDSELNKWFGDSGLHAPQNGAWTFPGQEDAFWMDLLDGPVVT